MTNMHLGDRRTAVSEKLQPIWRLGILSSALLFLLAFSGCASNGEVSQIDLGADPSVELTNLKEAMDAARKGDVHLLSPSWYTKANQSYGEAASLQRKGKDTRLVLEASARANTQLNKANKYAKIAGKELKGVSDARNGATLAGAPELYESEFERLERRFRALAEDIENDKISAARRNAKSVEAAYLDLELRAVKENTLGKARKLINQAIKTGAKKYAPKTLATAQASVRDTDRFITKNPRARSEIQKKAADVLNAAEHLQAVTVQAKTWAKKTEEDKVIWVEGKAIAIQNIASGNEDSRAQSLDGHFQDIEQSVEALLGSQKFLNAEVSRLQVEARKFAKETEEFAAKFDRVRKLFTRDEAEVYRQRNELLIRLKGLNFQVGKSYILPKHYPLLTKVQNSFKIFDTQKVVVEGHTDTTGSRATNERLSQARAGAVMSYLVNNNAIDKKNVTAIGYGPEKPIAPNTTRSGRKLNRRIDVVLTVR